MNGRVNMPNVPEVEKLKKFSVLVVDDEEQGRSLLANYLKPYVRDVFEAEDGEDAIKSIKTKKPDLVVTDIIMPGVDGIEFATKLKELYPKTPFIFLTASREREILLRVIESRPNSFLTKPLNTKALLSALVDASKEIGVVAEKVSKLKCGAIFDPQKGTITHGDKAHKLTIKELELLKLLVKAKGSIVSYELIESTIWGKNGEEMTEGALKNLIYRLRQKTSKDCITTMPGIGVKETK